MSANMFPYAAGGSYFGYHMWALNKQQMYADAPSPQVVDFAGDTSDFTVIPANARLQAGTPPAGSPEYFVSTEQFLNAVSIYKFHVDWDKVSTSTFTGPQTAAAPTCWPNSFPANAATPANAADTLAIRAMAQAQYSNIGGAESLWVDHTVNRGEFTIANCGGGNTNFATVRWYQANVTGGTVAANVVQDATYDPEGANTFYRFMPALAVDRAGDLAVTYTKSNSVTHPQIKYAGRLASDPLNTLPQTEQTLIDGTGSQSGNCGRSACTRWGDYSGMALDPNGCEFWMTGEYYAVTGLNHQTRIGSFHYPGCTPVGNGTLSGTVTDGSNPIAGATLTLGNRTTTTNGSGNYSFTVPAGTYASLTASKAGYDSASASTIPVPDGGTATRNFTLNAAAQSACFTDNTQSDFQRGVPSLGCDLTSSPGNVTLSNAPSVDQNNSGGTTTGTSFTSVSWGGQTFTPAVTGQLTKADFQIFCLTCTTAQNLTVSIRATSGGLPTGADIASTTVPGNNSGQTVTLTATFASPPTLTAGTQYALLVRPVSDTGITLLLDPRQPGNLRRRPARHHDQQRLAPGPPTRRGTSTSTTYMSAGFVPSATFVSSLKDANPAAGSTAHWLTLNYSATTPAGTDVKFQIAASNSQYGPFNFVGPDGTASTFFANGASLSQFNGFRYLRYKAYLSTTNPAVTPTLSSVTICFEDVSIADANIQITPQNATNRINTNHELTGHVNVNDGTGFINAPPGTQITFSLQSGPGGFVGGNNSCVTPDNSGSCSVQLTSATTGTSVVRASTTVTVGGATLNRATGDGRPGDSGDASKLWVNAAIEIAPNATNEVGQPHTFTATLLFDTGNGLGAAGSGQPITVTLSPTNGATPQPSGPFSGTTDNAGQFPATFTSATAGQVAGHASWTGSVAGSPQFTVETDGVAPNSSDAHKTFVDANIQITPQTASKTTGTNETLTGHVSVNDGSGSFADASPGTQINFALTNSGGASAIFIGPSSCSVGAGGTCDVVISSATPGTTSTNATVTTSIGGVFVTRSTGDGKPGDSPDASTTWTGAVQPPTCMLTATIDGPPKQIQITVQDTGGLAAIVVDDSTNADTVVPPFTPGTTSPVLIQSTKINQALGAHVALTATGSSGASTVCDPVIPGVKLHSHPIAVVSQAWSLVRMWSAR